MSGSLKAYIQKNDPFRSSGKGRRPAQNRRGSVSRSWMASLQQVDALEEAVPHSQIDRLKEATGKVRGLVQIYSGPKGGSVEHVNEMFYAMAELNSEMARALTASSAQGATSVPDALHLRKVGLEASRLFSRATPLLEKLSPHLQAASASINQLLVETQRTSMALLHATVGANGLAPDAEAVASVVAEEPPQLPPA
jgi:hypothetical protein